MIDTSFTWGQRITGKLLSFDRVLYACKKLIASTSMSSELNVLANELNRISEADRSVHPLCIEGVSQVRHGEEEQSEHVVAFTRRYKDQEILIVAPRLVAQHASWQDTRLISPTSIIPRTYRNVMTGETLQSLQLQDILKTFPVALFKAI